MMSSDRDAERTPLLSSAEEKVENPTSQTDNFNSGSFYFHSSENVANNDFKRFFLCLDAPPPAYETVSQTLFPTGSIPVVSCRVCHANINVEGKVHQHVVKCAQCNEATVSFFREIDYKVCFLPEILKFTANKTATSRQKICSMPLQLSSNLQGFIKSHRMSKTQLVSKLCCCERHPITDICFNSKRVITLGASPVGTAVRAPPGTCRISCAHCSEVFMFNTLNNSLARCPHCKKVSSVGREFARSRAIIFLSICLLFIIGGIALTAGLWPIAQTQGALFIVFGGNKLLSIDNLTAIADILNLRRFCDSRCVPD